MTQSSCAGSGSSPPLESAPREADWPLAKLRAYLEYIKATFQPSLTLPAQKLLTACAERSPRLAAQCSGPSTSPRS
jgi:hypothetical protein